MSARTILKHVYNNGGMTYEQYQKIDRNLKEQPHGSWEGLPQRRNLVIRVCTSCGELSAVGNFCMWCGADMMTQNDREVKNPCDTCKNVGDCEPCEKMREGEQE